MKLLITLAATLLASIAMATVASSSEPAYELTCRSKAKEIAAETYRSCVTEYKSAEIERLRKDYQDKLKSLKDDYEKEIEQLGAKTKAKKSRETSPKETRVAAVNVKSHKDKVTPVDSAPSNTTSVEVRPSTTAPAMTDDSTMDIPEPIPVEQ